MDKKVESRDRHLKALRPLVTKVRAMDPQVDEKYARWQEPAKVATKEKNFKEFKKLDKKLQDSFPKFFYKQKVIEEMILPPFAFSYDAMREVIERYRKMERAGSKLIFGHDAAQWNSDGTPVMHFA